MSNTSSNNGLQRLWQAMESLEAREMLSASLAHHVLRANVSVAKTAPIHVEAKVNAKAAKTSVTAAAAKAPKTAAKTQKQAKNVKAQAQARAAKANTQVQNKGTVAVAKKNKILDAIRGEIFVQSVSAAQNGSQFATNPIQAAQQEAGQQPETLSPRIDWGAAFPGASRASTGGTGPSAVSAAVDRFVATNSAAAQIQQLAGAAGIGQGPASSSNAVGPASGQASIGLRSAAESLSDCQQSFRGGLSSKALGDSRLSAGSGTANADTEDYGDWSDGSAGIDCTATGDTIECTDDYSKWSESVGLDCIDSRAGRQSRARVKGLLRPVATHPMEGRLAISVKIYPPDRGHRCTTAGLFRAEGFHSDKPKRRRVDLSVPASSLTTLVFGR